MRWLNKDNYSQNRIWIAVIPIVVFGLLGLPRLTDLTDPWSSDETTCLFVPTVLRRPCNATTIYEKRKTAHPEKEILVVLPLSLLRNCQLQRVF